MKQKQGGIGVYRIQNIRNGKFYIGSTNINFNRRWQQHINQLNGNKHYNRYLSNAWTKYGEESFIFGIIEYCEEGSVLEREQFYIDTLKPQYNLSPTAGSCKGIKHEPYSEERKQQISNTLKKGFTSGRIKHPMQGLKHNRESKSKMSSSKQGNSIRKENPTYIDILQIDIATNKVIAQHLNAGNAAEAIGLSRKPNGSKIIRACRETYRTAFGYKWRLLSNALIKSGELMETPEVDNHDPS